jgi:hypothetical protein
MDIPINETNAVESGAPGSLLPLLYSGVITRKADQTAANAVLSTAEMLSNIIYRLPFTDIVASTGVCHFWRNAVAADELIQKALFLSPEDVCRVLDFRKLWSP